MLARINVIGRLTETPKLRNVNTKDGEKECLTLKIATNDKLAGTTEEGKGEALFFQATVWEKQATALAPYVKRGDVISVSGHLHITLYENKEGYIQTNLEIKRPNVTLLPNPKKEESSQSGNRLKGKLPPKKEATAEQPPEEIPY